MKIFNKENGKEVVYVLKEDIIVLRDFGFSLPRQDEVEQLIINATNKELIRFEDPAIVEFYKSCDLIIDYSQYIFKSKKEILSIKKSLINLQLELEDRILQTSDENIKNEAKYRRNKATFQSFGLEDMYSIKTNNSYIKLPSIMLSCAPFYRIKNSNCCIKQGINLNEFFVYMLDGSEFSNKLTDDNIIDILKLTKSISKKTNAYSILTRAEWELSEDKKMIKITYKKIKEKGDVLKRSRKKE